METQVRTPYPTDVTDDEGAFLAPYLTLMDQDAPRRRRDLREVFNALRRIVRAGAPASAAWRGMTNGCRKRSPACVSSPSPA
jgi:transposase